MKVVAFVGHHNAGKTTLAEKVARILKKRGYKVGYVKHDPKGHGVTDKEGSDTDRLFKVLDRVLLLSPDRITLWDRDRWDVGEVIREFFRDFDIVLLEGFKDAEGIPKIAVGDIEAKGIVMKVERETDPERVVEFIERMEERV